MHSVLCLNAGSSSLKFALFRVGPGTENLLVEGAVERIGEPEGRAWLRSRDSEPETEAAQIPDLPAATRRAFEMLERRGTPRPDAVGHRLVHGGSEHRSPTLVDEACLVALRRLVPFAPLHLPGEIGVIEAARAFAPSVPQVGCFDTAFHRDLPEVAWRLPIPASLSDSGVRRYGFHGLSYEFVVAALGRAGRGRLVIAHLGNGSSLAAVRDGSPVDTTMGLTPTGGVVMATRSGDLDPGVLPFLARRHGWDADRLEQLVNFECGMLGVSGTTGDMEALLDRRDHDPRAALAVEIFCRSVRKHVGALAAVLDGIDTLVFTGGIGEHAAPVRAEICRGLEFLGIALDEEKNAAHADVLSPPDARCCVRRVATDEARMIARHVGALLRAQTSPAGSD